MSADKLFAACRQLTGAPYIFHAYVYDRATGRPIMSCTHRHQSRLGKGGKNGEHYAMKCAERMLRKARRRP